ncbi:MAG: hypothetical protein AAF960_08825 [Bacteroidota bacterium]
MEPSKDIQKELAETAPFLARLSESKKSGFQVPEHYFEQLSAGVLEQVALIPKPQPVSHATEKAPWYSTFLRLRWVGGLAAILLGLVVSMYVFNPSTSDEQLIEITALEATQYLNDHLDDFETALMVQEGLLVPTETLELDERAVQQYLEQNIDDIDVATLESLL